jgi:periplasmic divalent cation tolerance protein
MITCGKQEVAERLARTLVAEKLAACVNLVAGMRSIYAWEGAVVDEDEVLCLVKTTAARFEAMRQRVLQLHTYSTPEIIALPIGPAHEPYLEWLRASVKPD